MGWSPLAEAKGLPGILGQLEAKLGKVQRTEGEELSDSSLTPKKGTERVSLDTRRDANSM